MDNLNEVDSENNTCGMEIEFKRLTIQYKYSPNLFTSANLPVNHCKNRLVKKKKKRKEQLILGFPDTRSQFKGTRVNQSSTLHIISYLISLN